MGEARGDSWGVPRADGRVMGADEWEERVDANEGLSEQLTAFEGEGDTSRGTSICIFNPFDSVPFCRMENLRTAATASSSSRSMVRPLRSVGWSEVKGMNTEDT